MDVIYSKKYSEKIEYSVSSVKFITSTIKFMGNIIDLKLMTSTFNYYIVNNIIDKYFIFYYLKNIEKIRIV